VNDRNFDEVLEGTEKTAWEAFKWVIGFEVLTAVSSGR
jgi:hypothetical protein